MATQTPKKTEEVKNEKPQAPQAEAKPEAAPVYHPDVASGRK